MAGSGDEMAGAGGRSCLRVSHADREQVIDVLKAAFVQGRLAKDEFDLRIGQTLASRTYADLAALTADVPVRSTGARPPGPARESDSVPAAKTIARVTAAGAGASMVLIGAELIVNGGNPVVGLLVVGSTGALVAVLIAVLLTFLSRVLEKGPGKRSSQGTPPRASSTVAQRLAAADSAGQLPQISHDPRHTAEAVRNRLPRRPLASLRAPHRWRPAGRRYAVGFRICMATTKPLPQPDAAVAPGVSRAAALRSTLLPGDYPAFEPNRLREGYTG